MKLLLPAASLLLSIHRQPLILQFWCKFLQAVASSQSFSRFLMKRLFLVQEICNIQTSGAATKILWNIFCLQSKIFVCIERSRERWMYLFQVNVCKKCLLFGCVTNKRTDDGVSQLRLMIMTSGGQCRMLEHVQLTPGSQPQPASHCSDNKNICSKNWFSPGSLFIWDFLRYLRKKTILGLQSFCE